MWTVEGIREVILIFESEDCENNFVHRSTQIQKFLQLIQGYLNAMLNYGIGEKTALVQSLFCDKVLLIELKRQVRQTLEIK